MHQALAYLGLGTNLGEKEHNLHQAISALSALGRVLKTSSFHTSEPWGFESANGFLNAVVLLQTTLEPVPLLAQLQNIEQQLGRAKKTVDGVYADRLIDIDILLYDDMIIDTPELKIPHPHIAERDFVYLPLSEIAPEMIHPVTKIRFADLK